MPTSDIGFLLNKATRLFRLNFAAKLGETGLRPQQAAALMAIARSDEGRLTPRRLAEAIEIDAPTASGLLDRLERDGWISTQPNPEDGRSRLIVLTEKATNVLPLVFESATTVSDEATACLTTAEARELERLLSRVCACDQDVPSKGGVR